MTSDSLLETKRPALRPVGPIVRASDAHLWRDAAEAYNAAKDYTLRMNEWAIQAYEYEKARGYEDGMQKAAAEAATLIAMAKAQSEHFFAQIERDVPELVLEIINGILGSFDSHDLLAKAVRHALSKRRLDTKMTLRVAPSLILDLHRQLQDLIEKEDGSGIFIEADPALEPGRCVLWSDIGVIDLDIDAQIQALRKGFNSNSLVEASS